MKVFLLLFFVYAAKATEFKFRNNLNSEIWVGCQGNRNDAKHKIYTSLNGGGWKLAPGQQMSVYSDVDDWEGRFWGRTGCKSNTQHCDTGDCGNKLKCAGAGGTPPATLVEIKLKGDQGKDFYDISLVDGFNIKASIEPLNGRGDGSQYSCKRCACSYNFLPSCPATRLQFKNGAGQVVGCNSACNAFQTDEFCCRGAHDKPETCKSSDWPVNYPQKYKDKCPDAYSYAYDDHKSTFTCIANAYLITFG